MDTNEAATSADVGEHPSLGETSEGPASLNLNLAVGPPSPLTGCYLLIVIGEPYSPEHKDIILQKLLKGKYLVVNLLQSKLMRFIFLLSPLYIHLSKCFIQFFKNQQENISHADVIIFSFSGNWLRKKASKNVHDTILKCDQS